MEDFDCKTSELDYYECADAIAHWRERAIALDQWLGEQLPLKWPRVRQALLLTDTLRVVPPRELWLFFLCAFEIAKELTTGNLEQATQVAQTLASSPPLSLRLSILPERKHLLSVVPSHPVIQHALDSSWRPDIHGVSLVALPKAELTEARINLLQRSLTVLNEASPMLARVVRENCAAMVFVSTQPLLLEQGAVSLTVKRIPGLIFLSEVPLLLFIEGLVHESVHLWLNGVERVRELYLDSEIRLMTPLRKDPRPISGLMHQTWVLLHLVQLYRDLECHRHPDLAADAQRQSTIRAEHAQDLEVALKALEGASYALTANGVAFVHAMRRRACEFGPRPESEST